MEAGVCDLDDGAEYASAGGAVVLHVALQSDQSAGESFVADTFSCAKLEWPGC